MRVAAAAAAARRTLLWAACALACLQLLQLLQPAAAGPDAEASAEASAQAGAHTQNLPLELANNQCGPLRSWSACKQCCAPFGMRAARRAMVGAHCRCKPAKARKMRHPNTFGRHQAAQ